MFLKYFKLIFIFFNKYPRIVGIAYEYTYSLNVVDPQLNLVLKMSNKSIKQISRQILRGKGL